MTIDAFWAIVDRVHAASGGSMSAKCKLLEAELSKLPAHEVHSFEDHFSDCFYRAYSWDLWGAAHVITRGCCGDDSFMDFRSTLISMGQKIFEPALENPDSLADANIAPKSATYEGFQYVAFKVCAVMKYPEPPSTKIHPQEVAGTRFIEWEMQPRYPRLAAKYGYKDADYALLRKQADKKKQQYDKTTRLAHLLFESEIIPPCGVIPPFKVMAAALRHGRSDGLTAKPQSWEPIQLTEGDYWALVALFERLTSDDLKRWQYIHVSQLKLDVVVPPTGDYTHWLQSTVARGLAA